MSEQKDYFNEIFARKKTEKPRRFLADDNKWRCVACYEEDNICKCYLIEEAKESIQNKQKNI